MNGRSVVKIKRAKTGKTPCTTLTNHFGMSLIQPKALGQVVAMYVRFEIEAINEVGIAQATTRPTTRTRTIDCDCKQQFRRSKREDDYPAQIAFPPLDAKILPNNVVWSYLYYSWSHVMWSMVTDALTGHMCRDLVIELDKR